MCARSRGRLRAPIELDTQGRYAGFDDQFPLACSGGKRVVLESLPTTLRPLCFVGDGVTDLEAAASAERFIGYGGAVRRPEVERAADHYCAAPRLAPLLDWILTPEERERLAGDPRFAALLQAR